MEGTPLIGCGRSEGLWEESTHLETAEKFYDDPTATFLHRADEKHLQLQPNTNYSDWSRLLFLMIREKSEWQEWAATRCFISKLLTKSFSATFPTWEWGNEYRHLLRAVNSLALPVNFQGQVGLIHFTPWKVWNTSMPISVVLASANGCWSFDPNCNLKTKDFFN